MCGTICGMTDTILRKTVPLSGPEAALVERARTAGTPQHDALVRLVGGEVPASEAATLHALIGVALTALGEQIALADYEQLAESRDAEDDEHESLMRARVRDR
jgi:hypothetical protein